jgi:chemotaxis protein methyltransferase CheR
MTDQDFDYIRKVLHDRSAISLDSGKQYLVESRLGPLVQQLGAGSISNLVAQLQSQPNYLLQSQIVEALVTAETSFFRDHHPFDALRKSVIPELIKVRSSERSLKIWCAASSSGQEPYSLAMLIREHFPELATWQVSILATDISKDILTRAREGKFSQIEVNRGLPAALLVKHFQQEGTSWRLNENIRNMIEFREMNLAQSWPVLPRFDLILIRNVMIYFEVETKKRILGRISRLLRPDSFLLLGSAETTFSIDDSFRRVENLKSGFYQLIDR